MAWIGRFQKDADKDDVGMAHADWEDAGTVLFTYSQRLNGVDDAAEFKTNAIAARNKANADAARNEQLSTSLTNFLNA